VAAYIIASVEIKNPVDYQEYSKQVPAVIEKYGGKFLVRGGKVEQLEGEWLPSRMVIMEFESLEQAKTWYNSPEYQAIIGIRQDNSEGSLVLLEGYSPV